MKKILFGLFVFVSFVFLIAFSNLKVSADSVSEIKYLSDLSPIEVSVGYDSLRLDENIDGNIFTLRVDGETKKFYKSVLAHAPATVIYDLGEDNIYENFSSYYGIDAAKGTNGSVKFNISLSSDKESWTSIVSSDYKTGSSEAGYFDVSIEGYRYIKLYFDSCGNNGYDHSGLGYPILYKGSKEVDYTTSLINTLSYYNELLKDKTSEELLTTYKMDSLKRMFVEKIDYEALTIKFLSGDEKEEHLEMLTWLLSNEEALEEFMTGGTPDHNSYLGALSVLSDLYQEYKEDLADETALYAPESGSERCRGDVYRVMMLSIALTNDKPVKAWLNASITADPVTRYQEFKKLYVNNKLRNEIFENLNVEEMRWVMDNRIYDDEIEWLNAYTLDYCEKNGITGYPNIYSPHRHLSYGKDWDHQAQGLYDIENFAKYDAIYNLSAYGIECVNYNKLWMVLETQHICWGISYTGENFAGVFGVPANYCRQDGHAAFFVYNKNAAGKTVWSIDNNISGWARTWLAEDVCGGAVNRMLGDWGTRGNGWVSSYNATYLLLISTALDNEEAYKKAEILMGQYSLYSSDSDKEALLREVLEIMPYHLDAWEQLTRLYIANKSASEMVSLAKELTEEMYPFPLPMHDLLTLIKNKLKTDNTTESLTAYAEIANLEISALNKGKLATSDEYCKSLLGQPDACVVEANYLLGINNDVIATFSFDGNLSNTLTFGSQYKNIRYVYSLDGGTTWSDSKTTTDTLLTYTFDSEEIKKINATDDILIWIEGWSSPDDNKPDASLAFRIDILSGSNVSNIEANDNENKFFGTFTNLEYSLDGVSWSDLTESSMFTGDVTVSVRKKPTGVTLQGIESTYTFTANNTTDRSYISIDHLSIFEVSSEATTHNDYAKYVIDGKLSTRWHTLWDGSDKDRYIIIGNDCETFFSGFDYTPTGANGTVYAGEIYVSLDGISWSLVTSFSGWGHNSTKKSLTFTPVYGKYLKMHVTSSAGGFVSARSIELFEDATVKAKTPTGIRVLTNPNKTTYFLNQKFKSDGLSVSFDYGDDTVGIIPNHLLSISNTSLDSVGSHNVAISYSTYQEILLPITVKEADNSEATIGDVYYETFAEAVSDAINGDVITLNKDITVTEMITINKEITIDGDGHIIKRAEEIKSLPSIYVTTSGIATFKNVYLHGGCDWYGDDDDTQAILKRGWHYTGYQSTRAIIVCDSNSKIYLNEGTVVYNNYSVADGSAQVSGGALFAKDTAYVEVNGAHLIDCYTNLFGAAIYARDNTVVVINDAYVKGNSGSSKWNTTAICIDNNSKCTINGGIFEYNVGQVAGGVFWLANGSLIINSGTFRNNKATNGNSIYLKGNASVNINSFESLEEVYLETGKYLKCESIPENKIINIKMQTKTADSVVAKCSDLENITKLLLVLRVEGCLLYVDNDSIKISSETTPVASITRNDIKHEFISLSDAIKVVQKYETIKLEQNLNLEDDINLGSDIEYNIDISEVFIEGTGEFVSDNYSIRVEDNIVWLCNDSFLNKEVVYTLDEVNHTCTAKRVCDCGYIEEETIDGIVTVSQEQTCENDELSKYVYEFTNANFETKESDAFVTKEKLGHDYTVTYSFDEKTNTYTGVATCSHGHSYNEVSTVKSEIVQEQTCENDELTTFIYSFNDSLFEEKVRESVKTKDKLGHDYTVTYSFDEKTNTYTGVATCSHGHSYNEVSTVKSEIVQEQTCENDELTTFTYSFNDSLFEEKVRESVKTKDKLEHSFTIVNSVEATCENDGNISYKHCTICNKNYDNNNNVVENVTIKAKGHNLIEKELNGGIWSYCTNCNKYIEKISDAPKNNTSGCNSSISLLLPIILLPTVLLPFVIYIIVKKRKDII